MEGPSRQLAKPVKRKLDQDAFALQSDELPLLIRYVDRVKVADFYCLLYLSQGNDIL